MPGSLEEDLTATPINFFNNPYSENDTNKVLITSQRPQSQWSRLYSAEISYRPEQTAHNQENNEKNDIPVSVRFKGVKSIVSHETSHIGNKRENSKRPNKKIEINDVELQSKYEDIMKRLNPYQNITRLTNLKSDKQEKFFETYKKTQQTWDRNIKSACKALKRPLGFSVVARADNYREKVEKVAALDAITPSEIKYGAKNWSMGLRGTPSVKEPRYFDVQVGNSYNGLWMRIIDNPNKQIEVVRNPSRIKGEYKTFKDNPLLQEKFKKEAKKINEFLPTKDDSVEELCVF